jgi:predicted KAP-like P-loop ATPase
MYVEKIVQLEIALPELPPARLLELLITEIDAVTRGHVQGTEVQRFAQLLPSWPTLPTIRHIRRFISALSLLYEPLKEEVNAVDFASMIALRYS